MIKVLFYLLCIVNFSNSCCVKICRNNDMYIKICGDDLDLNLNDIKCDDIYMDILWESNKLITDNSETNRTNNELLLNYTYQPSPSSHNFVPSPVEVVAPSPVEVVAPSPVEVVAPSPVEVVAPSPVEVVASSPVEVVAPSPVEVVAPSPVEVVAPSPVEVVAPSPEKYIIYPSPSSPRSNKVDTVKEDLIPYNISPSSKANNSMDMSPNNEVIIVKENNILYIMLSITPFILLSLFYTVKYVYKNRRKKLIIPNNDIEMGDNMSDKTEKTQIAQKRENPYVEVKKVVEKLVGDTEKKNIKINKNNDNKNQANKRLEVPKRTISKNISKPQIKYRPPPLPKRNPPEDISVLRRSVPVARGVPRARGKPRPRGISRSSSMPRARGVPRPIGISRIKSSNK